MTSGNEISSELVRTQLQRIVACQEFDASDRNRRFLQYVVEETLGGQTDRIKAYTIATSVFGRDATFDPQADPIIRIEASRLRRSLERYYLTAGKNDPIRIEIPKGHYVPTFGRAEIEPPRPDGAAAPASSTLPRRSSARGRHRTAWKWSAAAATGLVAVFALAWLAQVEKYLPLSAGNRAPQVAGHGPEILVAPFDNDGANAADAALARGFTREVVVGLTRFDGLFVYGPETSLLYEANANVNRPLHGLPIRYVLTGGVTVDENRFHVTAFLVDANTGRNLWSETFERDRTPGDVFKIRDSIASRVVQTLAQPSGILYREEAKGIDGTPSESFTSYQCVLKFYEYRRTLAS